LRSTINYAYLHRVKSAKYFVYSLAANNFLKLLIENLVKGTM